MGSCPSPDGLHPEYVCSEDVEDLIREGGLCYSCEYKRIYDEFIIPLLKELRRSEGEVR